MKTGVPIIGILDSNCDPDLVDFPIPGNDDAIRAVGLLTRVVADAVAEGLIARSGGGAIINISSIIGTNGNAGQAVYSGSKAAVIGITKSLAKELAAKRIRVNAIAPGVIDTDMVRALPADKHAERVASIKMGHAGDPSEVAKVALFLASDLSTYVTGQVIHVDGGVRRFPH